MPQHAIGLKSLIWNNNLRSMGLLAAYPFILLGMLWAAGGAFALGIQRRGADGFQQGNIDPVAFGNHIVATYWPTLAAVVAIWFTISWFFQTGMIRMISHGRPVTRQEEPQLYTLLENLCIQRGMQTPALEIIESPAMNAFASGTDRRTFSITVTRGLLEKLQPDEVEAVLGHELTHIINRDVRLLMVTVIFTGMIGFAAQLLWSNLRYGLYFGRFGRNDREERGNPILLYLAILTILMIGYLASILARFALSRSREYMADAGSIELTHNPDAMMRALLRISGHDQIAHVTDDIAMMCIENSRPFLGLFSTHPSIEDRVKTISQITGTPIPALVSTQSPEEGSRFRNPWS